LEIFYLPIEKIVQFTVQVI